LENFSESEDINRAWENNKENIKISAEAELKQRKPWFDGECLGFLEQRMQAKMQCLQDPNHSNVDNVNNLGHEASTLQAQKVGIPGSSNR
jgi:hypothetical protein